MKEKNSFVFARATFRIVALVLLAMSIFVSSGNAAELQSLKIESLAGTVATKTNTVTWSSIVGIISAPNKNNPVGNINSGTFPWSARSGRAQVNLSTGATSFQVKGLVINGQIFSGTPGPVTGITGTLVCNPGDQTQEVLDTPVVPLNQLGNAHFTGQIDNIPGSCSNPLFLIRIAVPEGAAGFWIATGVQRSIH